MAVPFVIAAVAGGRVALPVILRLMSKSSAQAVKKYGQNAVTQAKALIRSYKGKDISTKNAINTYKNSISKVTKSPTKTIRGKPVKTKVKTKPKVEMKNTSAKNKNIANKVDKKSLATKNKTTKTVKGKPVKTKVETKTSQKNIETRNTTKTFKKIKAKPSNVEKIKPVKNTTTKTVKGKPVKTNTTKTTKTTDKKVDKKVDKKSLATKKKTDTKTKTTKTVKGKPVKNKPTVVGDITKVAPFAVGGGMLLGGLLASQKKKGKPNVLKIERKDKPSPDPKKSIGGTGRGEGALEFTRRSKDAAVKSMKAKQSLEDRKLYNNKVDTYESRIRALVKQKDKLTKIQSGDGRNEYQVRINKLKKENPKAFKKMFKLGGFGNLKD